MAAPLERLNLDREFVATPDHISARLRPTYETIVRINSWVSNALEGPQIPEEKRISEIQLNEYLDGNFVLSPRESMSPYGERFVEVAAQYESIRQINETTYLLKKWLVEKELPERVVAYQMGTGFPLPEENDQCALKGFIPYEDKENEGGILRHFRTPGEAGHDKDSGIYVYEVTGESNNKITLLAIKGREHGYSKTSQKWANHQLEVISIPS